MGGGRHLALIIKVQIHVQREYTKYVMMIIVHFGVEPQILAILVEEIKHLNAVLIGGNGILYSGIVIGLEPMLLRPRTAKQMTGIITVIPANEKFYHFGNLDIRYNHIACQ